MYSASGFYGDGLCKKCDSGYFGETCSIQYVAVIAPVVLVSIILTAVAIIVGYRRYR